MKPRVVLLIGAALLFACCALGVFAQETSTIMVKKADQNTGVVVVDIVRSGKAYELQCNAGVPGCAVLKAGKYRMVELPKNRGMYDCKCVEIYPAVAEGEEPGQTDKLGDYCLVDSKPGS
jgi:hypothetical protein